MKYFIGIFILVVVILLLLDESHDLEVTRHRVGTPDPAVPGVRIAQISDVHLVGQADVEHKVIQAVRQEDPDMVVLTGDMLPYRSRQRELEAFLTQLPARSEKYAILGNWEYRAAVDHAELRGVYARHGVTLLINESVMVRRGFLLVGLDDFGRGEPDWRTAIAAHAAWQGPVLILAHNPMTVQVLPKPRQARANILLLSGHTHGGQINLFGFFFKPNGFDHACMSGWCRNDEISLYVSRGIGTSIVPIRIGARPELAMMEWFPAPQ